MTKMTVLPREIAGKQVKTLRAQGNVPVALYGPKYDSTNGLVNAKEFKKAFGVAGHSKMVDVEVGAEKEKVIIKEVQKHPVTDELLHASLYVIDAKTEINAEIPVEFIGESSVEKDAIGFVVFALNTIGVRCLPKDLPSHLTVDISPLVEAGQSILVEQIKLPEGVEFDSRTDEKAAVAYVATAQKIEDVLEEIAQSEAAAAEAAEGEEGAEGAAEGEEGAEGAEGEAASEEGEKKE